MSVKVTDLYGFVVAAAVSELGGRVLLHIDSTGSPVWVGVVPVLAFCPHKGTQQRWGTQ